MHSWSNPPDLCLLSILAHIPLSELIRTFGLVCKYWARLQREEMNRRRTLVLVPHSYDLKKLREKPYGSDLIRHVRRDDRCPWIRLQSSEDIKRDVVEIPEPDKSDTYIKFYEPLLSSLSNITHLTIVRYNPLYNKLHQFENTQLSPELTPFHQMTRLLTYFSQSTKLISLNIKFKVYPWLPHYNITTTQANELIKSINELKSLQHLTMNVFFGESNPTLQLSILSRLNSFTVLNSTHSIPDTERLHVAVIFPNIQVLDLTHDSDECDECGYRINEISGDSWNIIRVNGVEFTEEQRLQIEQCMRKARQPFRDCAKLHTIKLRSFANILLQGLITRDEW